MNTSKNESALTPSDSVRVIQNEDGAVLLDIRQGLCLSMTPIGIRIWQMLKVNHSVCDIANCLAAEFDEVPKQQVHDDVTEFVADLEHKSLLVAAEPAVRAGLLERLLMPAQGQSETEESATPAKSKASRLLLWKALAGLLVFDLFRFGSNFTSIHSLVQRWPAAPGRASADVADRACRAMNYACVWYPKRVLCLQRSAVMTCLLRSCGVPAQMVIGAQKSPFKAHAWTEVNGHPVNERRDVHKYYFVWERC
jgi:hypothetical protein